MPTIKLSGLTPFAKGMTRRCYVHPDNPDRCLKVVIPMRQRRKFRARRLLQPRSWKDPNNMDYRGYRSVERLRDETVWRHIPRCHGFVETDLGRALSVEMMRDADGSVSRTLQKRIVDGVDDTLRAAFAELTGFIMRTGVYAMHFSNILAVREADGGERLVLAELEHSRSVLGAVPFLRHRRLHRHTARLNHKFERYVNG